MHVENSVTIMDMTNDFQASAQDIPTTLLSDSTVTSECGIQAASDTVCRGAQVAPLTRDAGCQYEDVPVPMATSRVSMVTPHLSSASPHIIKPSPIKQTSVHSPPTSKCDSVFLAAKALQQLRQNPASSSPLLTSPEAMLQSQIKALQSQAISGEKQSDTTSLSRGISGENPDSLVSLLQPGLMNSLPLTSYALLLDMVNRQNSAKSNLFSHLTTQGGQPTTCSSVLKPTPTLFTSGGMSSSSGGSSEVGNSSSQLNGARSVLNGSLNGSGVFNGTSLSSNGVLTPATLSSSLLSSASTMPGVGGLLNGMSPFMRPNSTPTSNIPTMLNRNHSNTGKRGFCESGLTREVDIESLVDSVIDEHMSHKPDTKNNNNSQYYEMTPPFKRRRRTVFTERQLQGLEEAYSRSQYLDRESRLELCKKLSLSLHTVVYWFQNKRAISRRRGQPLDTPNSSTVDSLHVYPTDHSKNSPPFKPCSPPSPSQFAHFSASPLKGCSGLSPPDMMTSPTALRAAASPGSSSGGGGLMSPSEMNSPPPSSSVMSTTLTSAISNNNVLGMGHMVGAATM